ncbi:TIGR01244 family sulfur transferase [Agrobacterium sp. ES01]|uniref:TIGR01244 family sulfur transferase n=1 Tax=Agrobacterium sp. ES01 TaxID=3420714 RepID=UPI003D1394EF
MDIRQVSDEYWVSGQITVEDLDEIKERGFKSIVSHRPDFEEPGQPLFDDIARRAEELGMKIRHIPVGSMGITEDTVSGMMDALDDLERPMLGFCRSGARSTKAYQTVLPLRG